LNTFNL